MTHANRNGGSLEKGERIEGKRAEGAASWGGVETVPSLIRQEERYDVDEMMLGAGQSENWSRGKYYFRRHSAHFYLEA